MPKSKNRFVQPMSYDFVIEAADGSRKIGELRIKPSSILWKPKSAQQYRSVTLEDFELWIVAQGKLVDK